MLVLLTKGGVMKLSININLDNAAYQEAGWQFEIESNLQAIVKRLLIDLKSGIVKDSNGNNVGDWSITGGKNEA